MPPRCGEDGKSQVPEYFAQARKCVARGCRSIETRRGTARRSQVKTPAAAKQGMKESNVRRVVRPAGAAKNRERVNFTFGPADQDGTTAAALKFD